MHFNFPVKYSTPYMKTIAGLITPRMPMVTISKLCMFLAPLDQLGPGRSWGLASSIAGRELDQDMMRVGLYRARLGLAEGSWISAACRGGRHPPEPCWDGSDQLPPPRTRQHGAQPLLARMSEIDCFLYQIFQAMQRAHLWVVRLYAANIYHCLCRHAKIRRWLPKHVCVC